MCLLMSIWPCCIGIAFSALWGAGVVQADELASPSLQATSQGKKERTNYVCQIPS